jgi:hypothetical protein
MMEKCRHCDSEHTRRIARSWWMRLFFPNSVRLLCADCDEQSTLLWRVDRGG